MGLLEMLREALRAARGIPRGAGYETGRHQYQRISETNSCPKQVWMRRHWAVTARSASRSSSRSMLRAQGRSDRAPAFAASCCRGKDERLRAQRATGPVLG